MAFDLINHHGMMEYKISIVKTCAAMEAKQMI